MRCPSPAQLLLPVAAALLFAVGCQGVDRRLLPRPGESQVLRVQSGDRWYFALDESGPLCRWDYTCDDGDVEVTIDHERGGPEDGFARRANVRVRIHRGYDGPSTIRFFCRHCRTGKGARCRPFTLSLFRRTGDAAFWE